LEKNLFTLQAIGFIHNARQFPEDDNWGDVVSAIELLDWLGTDALDGIEEFSHAEIIFYFHQVDKAKIQTGARYPRNNPNWPKVGILAQRGKNRPNRLGVTIVKILRREGKKLFVAGLDAIDGTPVLDIKPVMREFLPGEDICQPGWTVELMKDYWRHAERDS